MSARHRRRGGTPIITGENLVVQYRKRTVLDVPHFELCDGETHAILGPSGSGKSTLLRILGLLEPPAKGRVLLDGREVKAGDRQARMMMAAVFQNPYLFKGTVAENVAYGASERLDANTVTGLDPYLLATRANYGVHHWSSCFSERGSIRDSISSSSG